VIGASVVIAKGGRSDKKANRVDRGSCGWMDLGIDGSSAGQGCELKRAIKRQHQLHIVNEPKDTVRRGTCELWSPKS